MSSPFARAAAAVVDGDAATLRRLLEDDPALARARSDDAFRATLLHHVAANGIPDALQRTPENAVEIAEILLAAGAEPDATCDAYGGGEHQTPLCLLVSSVHPYRRGLQADLVRALVRGGASVDGRAGDGAPLTTALVFGYTSAAEALVATGAAPNNLFFAAGLGLGESVKAYFDADGQVAADAVATYVPVLEKELDPADAKAVVQEAFHFALTHGRLNVADVLFARGADVNGATTGHHCTLPLLQSVFVGETDAALWLLERGADPDLVDEKRGESARRYVEREGPPSVLARMPANG